MPNKFIELKVEGVAVVAVVGTVEVVGMVVLAVGVVVGVMGAVQWLAQLRSLCWRA